MSIDPHYNPPWAAASSLQAQIDALTMAEDVRRYQDMHRLAAQAHAGILDELNGLKRTLPELLQHAQMARLAAELGDHDRAAVERLSGVLGGGTLDYPSTLGSGHVSELAHAQAARIKCEVSSYRESADLWLAGDGWRPAVGSALAGIDAELVTLIGAQLDPWRHQPGYAEAFSALASVSDAIAASRASVEAYAPLFGDIRALSYSAEFERSAAVRLNAYRDAGFDAALLKPSQSALASMLSINGYVDPMVWERRNGLIVPKRRQRLAEKLRALKPTKFERKGYNESCALERWLRQFIDEEMSIFYGFDWHKTRAPKALRGRIKKFEINEDDVSGIIVLDEADVPHYLEIILHDDHWENVFEPFFESREDTTVMLQLFKMLRVSIAHHKGFGKADFAQLRACSNWFKVKIDGSNADDDDDD